MTTVGTIDLIARIDTSQYKKGAAEIDKANKGIESSADTTEKKSNSAFNGIAKVGLAALAAATVAVGVAITKNIGNAIDRIDTLVAFPRVLQALGATSDQAEAATDKLSKSLQGLPTSLQAGASGVQGLVTAGLDVDKATDAFLGLNNALLVAGGGADDTQIVMDSLQRAISGGTADASSMEAIMRRIPTVMSALSKETGKSQGELIKMFASDPQALIDNIIRLNKEGGGGLASLDKQAREATGGIGTAMDNVNNAITKGIVGIVKSLGNGDLAAGQERISSAITNVGEAFGIALGKAGEFVKFMVDNKNIFAPIIVAMTTIIGLLTTWFIATKVLAAGQAVLNAVLAANPIGLIIIGVIALIAAILWLWNNVEGFRNFFIGAWDMIKNAVTSVFNWVKNNWPLLLTIIAGPIGLAVAAVIKNFDKIKSAAQAVWNWIKKAFSTIGEIGASIVKGAVNSVLGFAERTINRFIKMINNALGAINKIPGVNIGKIGEVNIPKLAKGGIITAPTLALVGEGRESEAVIPLSKLDEMMNKDNSNQNSQPIVINLKHSKGAMRQAALDTIELVNEVYRGKGLPQIGVQE